ncbi:MAG TPA: NAD(P)/FAD-dependent oxidoreductase [Candidatus Angelobacter sp.]|nr:NAD(P)/FAD-dependent oxidoreductase [Candidatus Angelobacter sp.]
MKGQEDVIIIGGSFAGLTAALYLARARRDVLVIDSGEPRNRYSAHSHGVFALDGQPGSELLATAKSQLLKYPTARFVSKKASRASKKQGFFEVETEGDKERFQSRRLILATGLVDELPSIPGLRERWGKSIFHCPYCDGYEIEGGQIGVIATRPLSVHFAKLITDWGDVTLFTNGAITMDQDSRDGLTRKGVRIEERKIVGIDGPLVDALDGVNLIDGSRVSLKAIFIASLFRMGAPFARDLGCVHTHTPRGDLVQTDESKMTSIPGVYAAGDMSRTTHSIPFATADGVTAWVSAHQSLVMEEE